MSVGFTFNNTKNIGLELKDFFIWFWDFKAIGKGYRGLGTPYVFS